MDIITVSLLFSYNVGTNMFILLKSLFRTTNSKRRHQLSVLALSGLFGVLGLISIRASNAAVFTATAEAETGLIMGNAAAVPSNGASGTAPKNVVHFGAVPSSGTIVDITTFGAVCDGVTDDTVALQRAFDSYKVGTILSIPASKVCAHSDLLQARIDGLHVAGPGSLLATNIVNSAIHITAPNVSIENMTVSGTASVRDPQGRSVAAGVYIEHASGTVIRNVIFNGKNTGQGLGTNGIFNYGGDHFTFDSVTVNNSKADCIHNTEGANNGVITDAVVRNCGDDGIAVVSYHKDGVLSHDILIDSPKMYGQTWGRGMTVVGGNDITYKNIYIEGSFGAAIYVGTEGNEYDTYPATNIQYTGGTIVDANQAAATIDHGAILVTNYINPSVANSNITIRDMTIRNTSAAASKQVAIDGAPNNHIQFINIDITGGTANFFSNGNTPSNQYNAINFKYNGLSVPDHLGFTP